MKSYKPNQTTILYLNTNFNCVKGQSLNISRTSGGTGYTSAPTITVVSATGDGGYGATIIPTLTSGVISSITFTGGMNYNQLPSISITGGGQPGEITALTITNGGTGFTSAPTITATGGGGSGFSATGVITGGALTGYIITNRGNNYSTTPTINITGGGGTGAQATPTLTLGTSAVFAVQFSKCYSYTWNIPDININDLGRLSAINLMASGFATTTPYTFRISGLQIDSRNSFYSDYGDPILTMVQNTNIANNDALSGQGVINLSPQTIRQIQISVNDSLTTLNNGIHATIAFVIAIKVEEYDPTYTEIGDVYGESASRLKTML